MRELIIGPIATKRQNFGAGNWMRFYVTWFYWIRIAVGVTAAVAAAVVRWIANNDAFVHLFAGYCVRSETKIIWLWFGWIHFLVLNFGGRAICHRDFFWRKNTFFFQRSTVCGDHLFVLGRGFGWLITPALGTLMLAAGNHMGKPRVQSSIN